MLKESTNSKCKPSKPNTLIFWPWIVRSVLTMWKALIPFTIEHQSKHTARLATHWRLRLTFTESNQKTWIFIVCGLGKVLIGRILDEKSAHGRIFHLFLGESGQLREKNRKSWFRYDFACSLPYNWLLSTKAWPIRTQSGCTTICSAIIIGSFGRLAITRKRCWLSWASGCHSSLTWWVYVARRPFCGCWPFEVGNYCFCGLFWSHSNHCVRLAAPWSLVDPLSADPTNLSTHIPNGFSAFPFHNRI